MVSRFATNLVLLAASAFTLVSTFGLSRPTDVWVAFGLGCLTVGLSLVGFGVRERGALQRTLDLVAAVFGAWLVVASRALAPAHARWQGFAVAAALAALCAGGLLARELVLHRLHALPRAAG